MDVFSLLDSPIPTGAARDACDSTKLPAAPAYTPIPGLAHLKLLVPVDRIRYVTPSGADAAQRRAEALELVTLTLEVAVGNRPLTTLRPPKFDRSITRHLRAWQRANGQLLRGSTIELKSMHAQGDGEFHGSVTLGVRNHAFTGVVDNKQLRSFRLI